MGHTPVPKRVDEQALFEHERTAGYQRSLCTPTGTGYKSPEAYCNGNVGVPEALRLMPVPMGKEVDSKRSV